MDTHHHAVAFTRETALAQGESYPITTSTNKASTIHAEQDLMRKLYRMFKRRKLVSVRKVDILVIRLSSSGKLGMSRPCSECVKTLKHSPVPIGKVYYSSREGNIVAEKFLDLIHTRGYMSSGRRKRLNLEFTHPKISSFPN
ncbi:MAG: hypothetical protein K0U52_00740 [Gammaproteobacteria bacterium]|nr:hypothetical protein [Gammaproteobacteria bacterium]